MAWSTALGKEYPNGELFEMVAMTLGVGVEAAFCREWVIDRRTHVSPERRKVGC